MSNDDPERLSSGETDSTFSVDCFDCAPEYEPLRAAIDADDWISFADTIRRWPAEESSRALFHLGEHDDVRYQEFSARHESDPLGKVTRAYREVTLGWRARTSAPGSEVSPQQWAVFRHHLAAAELFLVEACAIDPTIPSAWTARVLTARALRLAPSEARRRYAHVQRLGGDFWGAYHLHQFLEPKWFGSVELARELVDVSVADAPDGSLMHLLVPLFHIERWYELSDDRSAMAYLASSEVQKEVDEAARRSVLHESRHDLSSTVVFGHQVFASFYWQAGEKAKAALHRQRLGTRAAAEFAHFVGANEAERTATWRELAQITTEDA